MTYSRYLHTRARAYRDRRYCEWCGRWVGTIEPVDGRWMFVARRAVLEVSGRYWCARDASRAPIPRA